MDNYVSESNPYSTKEREVNEQPNCNAPADYLQSLTWAGITHLVTANNHSLDGGLTGIEETIAHLDEYGILRFLVIAHIVDILAAPMHINHNKICPIRARLRDSVCYVLFGITVDYAESGSYRGSGGLC